MWDSPINTKIQGVGPLGEQFTHFCSVDWLKINQQKAMKCLFRLANLP